MREVRDVEEQIALSFFRHGRLPDEFGNLVADPAHAVFQVATLFAPATAGADLFAQALALGVALLERGFHFPPLPIDRQQFVDFCLVTAAPSREPAFHKVGLFANQPDVEHAEELSALRRHRKLKAAKTT